MKRTYTKEDFVNVVRELRKHIPDITISTDIICGFPTETEADFKESLALIKELKIPIINISKFYPRPGTLAAKMKPLDTKTVKQRTRKLSEMHRTMINNQEWLGWQGQVYIDEKGKNGTFIGRNYAYKQVVVKGRNLLGKTVWVEVKKTTRHDLRAELLKA
jgi:threonylcarbamoyladenosine tRNA methylthiotransferase CDKAL1